MCVKINCYQGHLITETQLAVVAIKQKLQVSLKKTTATLTAKMHLHLVIFTNLATVGS